MVEATVTKTPWYFYEKEDSVMARKRHHRSAKREAKRKAKRA
jgi:hypothetical protein